MYDNFPNTSVRYCVIDGKVKITRCYRVPWCTMLHVAMYILLSRIVQTPINSHIILLNIQIANAQRRPKGVERFTNVRRCNRNKIFFV